MDKLEKFLSMNFVWIVSILIALGGLLYSIKVQAASIEELQDKCVKTNERIFDIEKTLTKIDNIESNIQEIKSDIRGIKSVIYKPISKNYDAEGLTKSF